MHFPPHKLHISSPCNNGELELKPGDSFCGSFSYTGGAGEREISVEPLLWVENKPVLCSKSIVKKNIVCP